MTIETLFLVLIPVYLVLIAYGIVRGHRRHLPGRLRLISAAIMVVVPPAAIAVVLAAEDAAVMPSWFMVTLAMLVAGAVAALLTDFTARRIS